MAFTIIVTVKRKAGTTPEQFRDHYNNRHVPLVKRLTGSAFPLSHTRNFVIRTATEPSDPTVDKTSNAVFKPTLMRGDEKKVDYDCMTTMIWEDRAAWDRFVEAHKKHAEEITEDELRFGEPFELIVAEDAITTPRD